VFYATVIHVQEQFNLTSTAGPSGFYVIIHLHLAAGRHIILPLRWWNVKRRVNLTLAVSLSAGGPLLANVW